MGIVLITGKNEYEAEQRLKSKRGQDEHVRVFDAGESEASEVLESFQANSLFSAGDSTIVVMRPSENKELTDWLSENSDQVPESTNLILYDPKVDKRSKYYKSMQVQAEVSDSPELKDFEVVNWAQKYAQEHDIDIPKTEISFLVARIGISQHQISNELDKLALLKRKVTKNDIEAMVAAKQEDNVFALLDKIAAGNAEAALSYLAELDRNNSEPVYLISMVVWQLQNMLLVKTAGQRSNQAIAKEAGMSPFVVDKTKKLINSLSLEQLKQMLDKVIQTDFMIKTENINQEQALKLLIMELAEI